MTNTYSITGMTCSGCVAKVKSLLEQHTDVLSADISLEHNQAVVEMNVDLSAEQLQGAFGKESAYSIGLTEPIEIDTQEKSWLETYKPLLIIFLFISGVSGIGAFHNGQLSVMNWMNAFMAGFFIVFSFFKFLNLSAFADSYAMYDLLAKKVKVYGFVYPFIELALGIAYLTHFEPQITYIVTIVVMGFSSIGVIQSVLDKQKIRCACLGAVFNLPMSTVTIIEDLLMVAMAAFMLWTAY